MKFFKYLILFIIITGCKQKDNFASSKTVTTKNTIKYAKGFELYPFNGYSILKIINPWPHAKSSFTYILQQKNAIIPDSLKQFPIVPVPIKSIIVTSTTHIPALEILGVENSLIGFPNTDYISSLKTRKNINAGKVRNIGRNETINTEIVIDMNPEIIVGFGLNDSNPSLDILRKSGLIVILNGDWTEQLPLGKSEWIKFFGALYNLDKKADKAFTEIEKGYTTTLTLAKKATQKPTVLCGGMYQDQWYVPQGESWASIFLKNAQANYLWSNTKGIGSLILPFETVLEKAKKAEFWIAPGDYVSLKEMSDSNLHYREFDSFKNKKVYSYALNKGEKGGIIYFEWSPTRPDWVLKDLIKIFHPELVPDHQLYFFQKLE